MSLSNQQKENMKLTKMGTIISLFPGYRINPLSAFQFVGQPVLPFPATHCTDTSKQCVAFHGIYRQDQQKDYLLGGLAARGKEHDKIVRPA
jgi:hypothetical protein